jgi:hypothetical protein
VDTLVQSRLLSSRERFGREHDDRNLTKLRGLLDLLDEHEPVDAWHEEVKEDDIGTPVVDGL